MSETWSTKAQTADYFSDYGEIVGIMGYKSKCLECKNSEVACLCFFEVLRSGDVVAPTTDQYDPSYHLCFCE